jgi:hypothetical protein
MRLENNADLFELQKIQYSVILRNWQSEAEAEAFRALELLSVFERFNRHVYRQRADALMAAAIDLLSQENPRWLQDHRELTFNETMQSGQSSYAQSIYAAASLLVEDSHLLGSLLAAASHSLRRGGRVISETTTKMIDSIPFGRLQSVWEEQAHVEHVTLNARWPDSNGRVPGNRAFWSCIAVEILRNVKSYGLRSATSAVQIECDIRGSSWLLRAWGDQPFYESLESKYKLRVSKEASEAEQAHALRVLADRCIEAGGRLAARSSGRPGGGFGLAMINAICPYLGLSLHCTLADRSIGGAMPRAAKQAVLVTELSSTGSAS